MIVTGERRVPAAPAAVEALLLDLRAVGERLAIVTSVEEDEGGGGVRAVVRPETSLGATAFVVDAHVEPPTADRPLRFRLTGRRAENAMRMSVDVEVAADGDGAVIAWRAQADFYGVLAAVGQRALPAVANDQLDALFAAVAAGR